ncbi:TPA: hypothetical protein ACQQIU_002754 [Pseudomonas aeruginosa]
MFDYGKYYAQLNLMSSRFGIAWALLRDKGALGRHLDDGFVMHSIEEDDELLTTPFEMVDESKREGFLLLYHRNLEAVSEHYANMVLVTAYTYLEEYVSTLFYEAFLLRPESMIEYMDGDTKGGLVSLKEILAFDKQELLSKLARTCSAKACSGNIEKVCERIKKRTKHEIPKDLQVKLVALQNDRNEIVHEAIIKSIDLEYVMKSIDSVEALLNCVAGAASKIGIQVSNPFKDSLAD